MVLGTLLFNFTEIPENFNCYSGGIILGSCVNNSSEIEFVALLTYRTMAIVVVA